MAANDNRPVRVLQTSGTGPVKSSAPAGDGNSISESLGQGTAPVKCSRPHRVVIQPPGANFNSGDCERIPDGSYQYRHLVGVDHETVIIDLPHAPEHALESHATGRALMRALAAPSPHAATPAQAWHLTALVTAMCIAFLLAWALFGLPAPALPVPD